MANTKTGTVVANNCQKTITVNVSFYKNHPLYRKRYVRSKKYLVHDEKNEAQLKDEVRIQQVRPLSRHKRWSLVEILNKSPRIDAKEETARLSATLEEDLMPKKEALKKESQPSPEKSPDSTPKEKEKK